MNRPNKGGSQRAPSRKSWPAIQWAKVDPDEWAGGLSRPGYASDAGYDLSASRTVVVPADGFAKIPTNVRIAVPEGTWAELVGRSSTFHNRQLLVQTGIIDGGYRGEIWAVVKNMTQHPVVVQKKERLMQLVLHELITPEPEEVTELRPGDRDVKGFGSTGTEAAK